MTGDRRAAVSEHELPTLPNDEHLRGWKEIAAVVHASTRSAQRWERTMGLPVHRVQGLRGMQVFASREDLVRWMASDLGRRARESAVTNGDASDDHDVSQPEVVRRPWRWAVLAASLVAAAVVAWVFYPTSAPSAVAGQTEAQAPSTPMVNLKIAVGTQRPVVIGIPNGTLGRISLPRNLGTLGFIPRLAGNGVDVQLFQIDGTAPHGEPLLTELGRASLAAHTPVHFDTTPTPVRVEWVAPAKPEPPLADRR
jgi:hypothetical protein